MVHKKEEGTYHHIEKLIKEMPGFISPGRGLHLLLIPEYSGINKEQRIPDRSKTAHRKLPLKCFLTGVVQLFVTLWAAECQASQSFTISQRLLKLKSIELMMPSKQLILCSPLFLLPSIFPGLRVLSNESALPIRWPKYWSFSFSISSSMNIQG